MIVGLDSRSCFHRQGQGFSRRQPVADSRPRVQSCLGKGVNMHSLARDPRTTLSLQLISSSTAESAGAGAEARTVAHRPPTPQPRRAESDITQCSDLAWLASAAFQSHLSRCVSSMRSEAKFSAGQPTGASDSLVEATSDSIISPALWRIRLSRQNDWLMRRELSCSSSLYVSAYLVQACLASLA